MEENKKTEQIKQMIEESAPRQDDFNLLEKDFEDAKRYYSEKNSTVKAKSIFSKDGFFFPDDDKIYKLKHDFIVDIVGIANEKKDVNFENFLKDMAKKFDEKLNGNINESLFLTVVTSYPELLSKSDLKWMVDNVKGKKERFVSLCNFLLCYINPEKEPNVIAKDAITSVDIQKRFNFIWEIFKAIKYYGEDWAEIGETYLDELFGDDYVSFGIFTTQFFKKRRAKSFIKEVKNYASKYLKNSRFDLLSSEIYDHYCQAKKVEKKRNVIIGASTVASLAVLGVGAFVFLNSINISTIEFHIKSGEVLIYTYNEQPDLENMYITYKKHNGEECKESVTYDMFSNINKSKIGVQQSVDVVFHGKKYEGLQVRIDPASISAPIIQRARTSVQWASVNNATGYEIYVEDTEITQPTGSPKITLSESARACDISNYCKEGQDSFVYVRAIFDDGDGDYSNNIYNNSALSNGIQVKKLGKVNGVKLEGKVLSWNAVEGATKYKINVGTNSFETQNTFYNNYEFNGGEEITVSTFNNSETVLDSSATFNVLEKVSSITYEENLIKWAGGPSNSKYNVTVKNRATTEETKTGLTDKSIDVSSFSNGIYDVTICVCGEGANLTSPDMVKSFAIGYETTVNKSGATPTITWNKIEGCSYEVYVQGKSGGKASEYYEITSSVFATAGDYTISIVATDVNDNKIYLKSATVTKLKEPKLELNKNNLSWADNQIKPNQVIEYSVNGEQKESLPTEFDEGVEYVIKAYIKTDNEKEINSNEVSVSVYKLTAPQIKVDYNKNELVSVNALESGVNINFYYLKSGNETQINSLNNLSVNTEYKVIGIVSAENYGEYTYVLPSDRSEEITVKKYSTPTVDAYNSDSDYVTVGGIHDTSIYTFYYKNDGEPESTYQVLSGGYVASLPAGVYNVMAVQNGKEDGGIYYLTSNESQAIPISKANISFYVDFEQGRIRITLTMQDIKPFDYEVVFYGDSGNILKTTTNHNVVLSQGLTSTAVAMPEGTTKVKVTITMNGVSVTQNKEKE